MEEGGEAGPSIADRLDHLFKTVSAPNGREHSCEDVAAYVRKHGGVTVSHTYIWKLRHGQSDNPSLKIVSGLAAFFGVPTNYFVDRATQQEVDRQLQLVQVMRDAGVRQLALRAYGLSPASLAAIENMIDQVRRLEGLEGLEKPDDASAEGR